jgi:hypothetical protein
MFPHGVSLAERSLMRRQLAATAERGILMQPTEWFYEISNNAYSTGKINSLQGAIWALYFDHRIEEWKSMIVHIYTYYTHGKYTIEWVPLNEYCDENPDIRSLLTGLLPSDGEVAWQKEGF